MSGRRWAILLVAVAVVVGVVAGAARDDHGAAHALLSSLLQALR